MIVVAVYLKGDNLDPGTVTQKLGVSPSSSQILGTTSVTVTNKKVVAKTGVWKLSTDGQVDSPVLSRHLDHIKACLAGNVKTVASIQEVEESFLDVFFAIDAKEGHGQVLEFELTLDDLNFIQELGLPVQVAVYY